MANRKPDSRGSYKNFMKEQKRLRAEIKKNEALRKRYLAESKKK